MRGQNKPDEWKFLIVNDMEWRRWRDARADDQIENDQHCREISEAEFAMMVFEGSFEPRPNR